MAYDQFGTQGMLDFVHNRHQGLNALKVPTNGKLPQHIQQPQAQHISPIVDPESGLDPEFEAFMNHDNRLAPWDSEPQISGYVIGDSYPNTTSGGLSPARSFRAPYNSAQHFTSHPFPQYTQAYFPAMSRAVPAVLQPPAQRLTIEVVPQTMSSTVAQDMAPTNTWVQQALSEPVINDIVIAEAEAEAGLDYEQDELYALEFKTLQNQSFDEDPRTTLAQGHGPDGIKIILEALLQDNTAIAEDYFKSMSTTDWELSGAWIKAQIGSVTDELTNLRNSRRATAKSYESQTADCHTGVMAKMQALFDAKQRAKSAGRSVLDQSTKRKR